MPNSNDHAPIRRSAAVQALLASLFFLGTAAAVPQVHAAVGDCGTPLSSTTPKTSDCLYILHAAVGNRSCALCTCDVNNTAETTAADALACLRAAVGQDVPLVCPPCSAGCPGFVEWTTAGGLGQPCDSGTPCSVGACDESLGRCVTETELDLGWKGTVHDTDIDAGSVLRVIVQCEGSAAGCGTCEVQGVDPAPGNCRCANDTRTTCDEPFETDADDCPACAGGGLAGKACADNGQCDGGPCTTFCSFDPDIPCAVNADCPTGRKLCSAAPRCGDGEGLACESDDDCLGTCKAAAACDCYEAPPQPVASVEFPFCVVPRLTADVTGTVDVDSGASRIDKRLEWTGYGALSLSLPCPVCGGACAADAGQPCVRDDDCGEGDSCLLDATANDGVRDGTCVGGRNDGESCDVAATNVSFPLGPLEPAAAVGESGYSLDCLPDSDATVTGPGLRVRVVESTGTASLDSTLPCDPGASFSDTCPCLVCTGGGNVPCSGDGDCSPLQSCSGLPRQACDSDGDCLGFDLGACTAFGNTRCSEATSVACSTNAECESVDFGVCGPATCSSLGSGVVAEPNGCDNGLCTQEDDGEGFCESGPEDTFCDGLVQADGSGIRRCDSDADCSEEVLGFDAGTCTLVEARNCFPEPIVASGAADPNHPLSVAAACVPPGTNVSANLSIGLPGPARIRRRATLTSWCESDPASVYVPGGGGCPPP
ncbi:MAG: hypothetical protein ABR538_04195 [Candidatus Binatia bacterium]